MTKIKRNHHLDNAKFWLIVLVVFAHVIEPGIGTNPLIKSIYLFIYAFHIPAFAFLSGYFSKKESSAKSLLKLFFLYIFFQLIYSFFTQLPFELLNPHWVLWYLLSLLTWRLMLPYFLKLKYSLLISIIIGLMIGMLPMIDEILSLSRTFYFLPFFLSGYWVAQKKSLHSFLFKKFRWLKVFSFLLLFILTIVSTSLFEGFNPEWLWAKEAYPFVQLSFGQGVLLRLGQYVTSFLLMFLFLSMVPFAQNKLTALGQRSLYVFAWHGLLLIWFRHYSTLGSVTIWLDSGWLLILIALLSSFILTLLLSMKWMEKLTLLFWKPFCRWISNK